MWYCIYVVILLTSHNILQHPIIVYSRRKTLTVCRPFTSSCKLYCQKEKKNSNFHRNLGSSVTKIYRFSFSLLAEGTSNIADIHNM